jgi:hypothetical protein
VKLSAQTPVSLFGDGSSEAPTDTSSPMPVPRKLSRHLRFLEYFVMSQEIFESDATQFV